MRQTKTAQEALREAPTVRPKRLTAAAPRPSAPIRDLLSIVARGHHQQALDALHALLDKNFIPVVIAAQEAIETADLDPRLALLLSCIDGMASLESLIEASGLETFDALEALGELLDRELVALR